MAFFPTMSEAAPPAKRAHRRKSTQKKQVVAALPLESSPALDFSMFRSGSSIKIRVHCALRTHTFTVLPEMLLSAVLDACPSLARGNVRLFTDAARAHEFLYTGINCRYVYDA